MKRQSRYCSIIRQNICATNIFCLCLWLTIMESSNFVLTALTQASLLSKA